MLILQNFDSSIVKQIVEEGFIGFIYLFIYLINTTLKLFIMGLPGEWKEHESFKERDMNVVE